MLLLVLIDVLVYKKHVEFSHYHIFFIIGLSTLNVACAKSTTQSCGNSNVQNSLICVQKNNEILKSKLKTLKNTEKRDYIIWKNNVEQKCEGKSSYSLGEGAALIREGCYNSEYANRLDELSKNEKTLPKKTSRNDDGVLVTSLPYNSNDHISCLLTEKNNSCNKVNLNETTDLVKTYNFINASYGASVVFPENENGILLIASPSSSDSETPNINLTSVNQLGIVHNISLDASKNILINKKYEIIYVENGKMSKLFLNKDGEFK